MTQINPLLEASSLPHGAVPFDTIKTDHYLPALREAIRISKAKVEQIKKSTVPPNFQNTIEAMETCSEPVDTISLIYFNLLNAEASEQHQELAQEFSPLLADFSSDLSLDPELFRRVKTVYDNRQEEGLTGEKFQLVEKTYINFVRNGALLDEKQKSRLREIDQELSKLAPQFSQNILKSTNKFEWLIRDSKKLSGLPESALEEAQQAAKEKGFENAWLITLHGPSYVAFITYADDRAAREALWRAFNSRAFGNEYDNQELIKQIVALRHERAQLLGFQSHAEFVLQERMAESSDKVFRFLDELLHASKSAAERDLQDLRDFRQSLEGSSEIQPWDVAYYSEKLQQKKLGLDQELLRPYFELNAVINGVFEHAKRLYGLQFTENRDITVYHPDVKVFEVTNQDGSFVGLFYTDFFPRATKKNGGWMTTYRDQGLFAGKVVRPHVSIVCNFTKPTPNRPSLLTFDEVRTLFHEFGHSLHALLSKCQYRSLSGTNVYWDFVELPSQIMENWTLEKESLDLFAKHYKSQEKIPQDLANKLKASAKFMAGWTSLRQINYAMLDMAWHSQNPDPKLTVDEFEIKATAKTNLIPKIPGTNLSCAFSHIFGGGYSAGYYSYKWAEVLDADAFELFKEKGIFSSEVAARFRENVLEKGGTEHPMSLYKKFRGREPDPKALLRRDGLI